jgi:hypothetical protein
MAARRRRRGRRQRRRRGQTESWTRARSGSLDHQLRRRRRDFERKVGGKNAFGEGSRRQCKRSPNLVCLREVEEGARKRCKVTWSHALQASPRATDRYSAATIDHGLTSLRTSLFLFNTMIASALLLLPLLASACSARERCERRARDAPLRRAGRTRTQRRARRERGHIQVPCRRTRGRAGARSRGPCACVPTAGETASTSHSCPFATENTNAQSDRRRFAV